MPEPLRKPGAAAVKQGCGADSLLVFNFYAATACPQLRTTYTLRQWKGSAGGCDNGHVIVWDFETRREVYRLQEHDHGVAYVGLTDDERFLLSVGVAGDKKMVVWDMETGRRLDVRICKQVKLRVDLLDSPSGLPWARMKKKHEQGTGSFA